MQSGLLKFHRFLGTLATCFAFTSGVAAIPSSDSLVALAWHSWTGHSSDSVERLFRDALAINSLNSRAHIGLALFYTLQDREDDSWQAFSKALTTVRDPYPYLFATWFNPRFAVRWDGRRADILKILKSVAEDDSADGALRGQACETLGNVFREEGDLAASDGWHERTGAILHWTLNGPYENISASGFERIFPPEGEYDTSKTYEGKNAVPARWFPAAAVRSDGWLDHLCYFAYSQSVYYANTFVYSPARQPVHVRVGTSGSLKVFLNDELLLANPDENNNALDTYVAASELQQGWNRLLVKCGYSEITKCNFKLRVTDTEGNPLAGLRVSHDPQTYTRKPGAPVRLIPNFAEEFFRERIRQAPDVLENYVLLADCYSRNDKAVEAELILREALKRLPDCPLLLVNLSEAYARGEKYDEMNQALDRILEIDPAVPAALQHQLDRALKSENFDEAQGVLDRLEQLRPGSSLLYESRMKYYSARKQIDKIIETNAEAFSRHPDDWNVVYLATVIANQTTQKYDRAIEILKEFVKRHYTTGALFALADCYQRSSQMDRWEETFGRLFKHDPCTPGWHSKMAEVYFSLQQYANAERALKAALAICPNNSNYWSRLGNVYRSVKDPVSATTAYRAALTYAPTDFEARESLREIEGKRSSFARFRSFAIDSLVRSAPDARAYPNDKGIILLDDTRRVVFEGGTSVVAHETLAKIFTRAGIDDLKEFQIAYNANNQQLIVEKALSLKRDGSQVKADVEKGYVVFKSLEEGDCIYLKWKVKDYYSGRLSRHFWDTKRFNRFLPVRACRYALLVPQGYPFRHSTQNMPDAPTTASSEDGTLYEWMLNDQDAIAYEQGMPGINDVGRTLFLSTIPSWEYLVDWYADLAHTKTTSSFEIRERVAALMAEKSAASEEDRIRVIYEYITENIRYSFVSFRQSGFVPQKARDVLVNRLGDCKDMTTLFIAMLREVGLDAHYVLVNTIFEGENRNALPAIVFDHCIAAVETRAGLRYFDVTASDYPMGSAPLGDLGAFALRITPDTRSPVYLEKSLFSPGTIRRLSQVVARADNSVSVRRQSTRVGSAAGGKRSEYRSRGQEDRGKALTQLLAEEYPNMKLVELSIRNLDVPSDTLIDEYAFEIPGYVTESGPFRLMKIPWTDILPAVGALSYEKRVHQTNYWPDADTLTEEMRITLPPGYVPVAFKPRTQHTSPNATYTCTLQYAKGILSGRRQFVHVKTAVPPQDYQAFKAFYTSVMKEDGTQVLLRKK